MYAERQNTFYHSFYGLQVIGDDQRSFVHAERQSIFPIRKHLVDEL